VSSLAEELLASQGLYFVQLVTFCSSTLY